MQLDYVTEVSICFISHMKGLREQLRGRGGVHQPEGEALDIALAALVVLQEVLERLQKDQFGLRKGARHRQPASAPTFRPRKGPKKSSWRASKALK